MLTDYELFLSGCYSAVVEIKNDYELYGFIDLMKKLGLGKYAEYIEKQDMKSNFIDTAKRYNNVKDLCIEYQMGKGFTFADKNEYLANCEEVKILSLNDLKKATGYDECFKKISLTQESGGYDLDILDDFCEMYGWSPVNSKYGFAILDTELDNELVDNKYYTFGELVDRIVSRAISYYEDELEYEDKEEELNYGLELLRIAKKYCKENRWLNSFEEELKDKKGE